MPDPLRSPAADDARHAEEAFADALHRAGLRLSGPPVMDGTWRRAAAEGDKGWRKSARYRGFLDGRPAGFIQNFRTGYAEPWVSDREMPPLTFAERARIERERELRAVERAHDQAHAEREAYIAWMRGSATSDDHQYLLKKGVKSHGLKVDARGRLLLPARDATGWLGSVQTIDADGAKLFPEGGRKTGLSVPIGPVASRRPLLIAEGYATAATLHEATGLPCLAAFDAGNLLPVALAWREKHPHRRMVIAGDDDHQLRHRDSPLPNVGAEKAHEAAEAIAAALLLPEFVQSDGGLSDWQDWAERHGRESLADLVFDAVREAPAERQRERVVHATARTR